MPRGDDRDLSVEPEPGQRHAWSSMSDANCATAAARRSRRCSLGHGPAASRYSWLQPAGGRIAHRQTTCGRRTGDRHTVLLSPVYRDLYWRDDELTTIRAIEPLASELGIPMAALAVAWTLAPPATVSSPRLRRRGSLVRICRVGVLPRGGDAPVAESRKRVAASPPSGKVFHSSGAGGARISRSARWCSARRSSYRSIREPPGWRRWRCTTAAPAASEAAASAATSAAVQGTLGLAAWVVTPDQRAPWRRHSRRTAHRVRRGRRSSVGPGRGVARSLDGRRAGPHVERESL